MQEQMRHGRGHAAIEAGKCTMLGALNRLPNTDRAAARQCLGARGHGGGL